MKESVTSAGFQDVIDLAVIHLDRSLDTELSGLIKRSKKTIVVVETITNGALCNRLSRITRATDQFLGGLVCPTTLSQMRLLAMPVPILKHHPATSAFVEGVLECIERRMKSDIYVTVTGVQHQPDLSSIKRKGVIIVGIQYDGERRIKQLELEGDATTIRNKAVQAALMILKQWLSAKSPGG